MYDVRNVASNSASALPRASQAVGAEEAQQKQCSNRPKAGVFDAAWWLGGLCFLFCLLVRCHAFD